MKKGDSHGPEPEIREKIVKSLVKKRTRGIAQKSNRKFQEMIRRMEVNLMLPMAEVLNDLLNHLHSRCSASCSMCHCVVSTAGIGDDTQQKKVSLR
jgi:hypothetical protein